MGRGDVVVAQDAFGGDRDGEDGGLGVLRLPELLDGPVETQRRQGEAEGFVCFFKDLPGDGKVLREIAAHPDCL